MFWDSEEYHFCTRMWKAAFSESLSSRYLLACLVYMIYSVGMVLASSPHLDSATKNSYYFYFGIVHLVNAFMFVWTWEDKSYLDAVMIPEYLNITGAVLYLWSR